MLSQLCPLEQKSVHTVNSIVSYADVGGGSGISHPQMLKCVQVSLCMAVLGIVIQSNPTGYLMAYFLLRLS